MLEDFALSNCRQGARNYWSTNYLAMLSINDRVGKARAYPGTGVTCRVDGGQR